MGVKTTDTDLGRKAALREMQKMKRGPYVANGFQGVKGEAQHRGTEEAMTVAQVAAFNEFGTKTIPERSFMRATIDENRRTLTSLTRSLLFRIGMGEMTTERALNIIGLTITKLMKKKIVDLRKPPNADSTIKRKNSSNPLIDSSQMLNSVTDKVEMNGDREEDAA